MYRIFTNGFVSDNLDADAGAIYDELRAYVDDKDEVMNLIETGTLRSNDRYTAVIFNRTALDASWGTLSKAIHSLDWSKDMERQFEVGQMLADYSQYYSDNTSNWVRNKNALQTAWAGSRPEEFEAAKPVLSVMFSEILVRAFSNACAEAGGYNIPTANMIRNQCRKLQRKLEIEYKVLKRTIER